MEYDPSGLSFGESLRRNGKTAFLEAVTQTMQADIDARGREPMNHHFKSRCDIFGNERNGNKPNTVRLLDADDPRMKAKPGDTVTITHADNGNSFTRTLTWVGQVSDILGKRLMVFCWDPREEEPRQSGRTTRMLEQVLAAVKEGRRPLVVAGTYMQSMRVRKLYQEIGGDPEDIIIVATPPLVPIAHDGIFFDHYYLEHCTHGLDQASTTATLNVDVRSKSWEDVVRTTEAITSLGMGWTAGGLNIICDGCDKRVPVSEPPTLPEGWTERKGDHYCPECEESKAYRLNRMPKDVAQQ